MTQQQYKQKLQEAETNIDSIAIEGTTTHEEHPQNKLPPLLKFSLVEESIAKNEQDIITPLIQEAIQEYAQELLLSNSYLSLDDAITAVERIHEDLITNSTATDVALAILQTKIPEGHNIEYTSMDLDTKEDEEDLITALVKNYGESMFKNQTAENLNDGIRQARQTFNTMVEAYHREQTR